MLQQQAADFRQDLTHSVLHQSLAHLLISLSVLWGDAQVDQLKDLVIVYLLLYRSFGKALLEVI